MNSLDEVSSALVTAEVQLLAAAVYIPAMTQRVLTSVQAEDISDEKLQEAFKVAHRVFEERDGLTYGALSGAGAPQEALRWIAAAKLDILAPFATDALQGFLGARAAARIHRLLSGARVGLVGEVPDAESLGGIAAGLDIAIQAELARVHPPKPKAEIIDLMAEAYGELQSKATATYGIEALDNWTAGLRKGTLHILGAPTGGGKSAMALTAALATATRGERVLFVTKEMNSRECSFRVASMLSGLRRDEIVAKEWRETRDLIERKVPRTLTFADNMGTVNDIRAAVHRADILGEPYGLVVVDYLQQYRVRSGSANSNAVEEIDYVVETLKDLSVSRDCAVLAPAQFNRSVDTSALAQTEHLRGSGGIEQYADVVVMLRGSEDVRAKGGGAPQPGKVPQYRIMECAVRKARNGRRGVIWGTEKGEGGSIDISEPLKFGLGTFRFWDSKYDPWTVSDGATQARELRETGSIRESIGFDDDELERMRLAQ